MASSQGRSSIRLETEYFHDPGDKARRLRQRSGTNHLGREGEGMRCALEARQSGTACPTCSELGEYIEIENPQAASDEQEPRYFPAAVAALRVPNALLERYYRYTSERLPNVPIVEHTSGIASGRRAAAKMC